MFFKALAACLLALSHIVVNGQPSQSFQLPSKVKVYVDRNYPGWRYFSHSAGCESDVRRSILLGDFNGDGTRDYVLKIESNNNGALIAFISTREGYRPNVIIKESARVVRDIGFTIGHRGTRVITSKSRSVMLRNDVLLVESCATRRDANYWAYRNGAFEAL